MNKGESMKRLWLKEVIIFGVLLLGLALLMHGGDLGRRLGLALTSPSHFIHPILWTFPFYLLVWLFRVGFGIFSKRIRRTEF